MPRISGRSGLNTGEPASPADVHLWFAGLNVPEHDLKGFWRVLSEDERDRARRFRFSLHRSRFVASRGILRLLLGSYLNVAPEVIAFTTGRNGKPEIDPETSSQMLR